MIRRLLMRMVVAILNDFYAARQNMATLLHWVRRALGGGRDRVTAHRPLQFKRVAVFASFERAPGTFLGAELAELVRAGFDIVFVSNLPLDDAFQAWLGQWVHVAIERPNVARDFGAYRCGYLYALDNGLLESAEQLLFINDTIFFPLFDATSFWADLNARDEDVVGPYMSCAPTRHVQSYFVLCRNGVFRRDFFQRYWRNYKEWNSRRYAIRAGELGFSQTLLRHDVSMGGLIDSPLCARLVREHGLQPVQPLLPVPNGAGNVPVASVEEGVFQAAFRQLCDLLETQNPSHALGRFAVQYARLPLFKKDVVYRGTLRLGEIVEMHEACGMTLPLEPMVYLLRRKGLPAEKRLIDRLAERVGAK